MKALCVRDVSVGPVSILWADCFSGVVSDEVSESRCVLIRGGEAVEKYWVQYDWRGQIVTEITEALMHNHDEVKAASPWWRQSNLILTDSAETDWIVLVVTILDEASDAEEKKSVSLF